MTLPVALLGPAEAYTVPSRSEPHRAHIVIRLVEDRWACSCPSRSRKDCAHIKAVKTVEEFRGLRVVGGTSA